MIGLVQTALPPTIIVDGFVVGARSGGKWREVAKGRLNTRTPVTFRSFGLTSVGPKLSGTYGYEEVPAGFFVRAAGMENRTILVAGLTPKAPRRATEYPTKNPGYVKAMRSYLDRVGLKKARVRITRIVGVDLDGDGTREILIEAQSSADAGIVNVAAGMGPTDYSVVLLRAIRAGKVVDLPLATGRTPYADGLRRQLRAIADIDGDGRMEIVLSWDAWEAGGGALWSYRAGRAVQHVESGTGV